MSALPMDETETGLHATCCRYMLHLLLTDTTGMVLFDEDDRPYASGEHYIVPFRMKNILLFTAAIMKERERHTGNLHLQDHSDAMVYGLSAVQKKPSLSHLLRDAGDLGRRCQPPGSEDGGVSVSVPYDGRKAQGKREQREGSGGGSSGAAARSQDNVERKAWEAFKEFVKRCNARPGNPEDKYADYLTSTRWHIRIKQRAYADIIPLIQNHKPLVFVSSVSECLSVRVTHWQCCAACA
jgi:hypothetical protein